MQVRLALLPVLAGVLLAACQTPPPEVPVAAPSTAVETERVPPPDPAGPQENEWGGEIPQTLPTTDVGEDGIGELP